MHDGSPARRSTVIILLIAGLTLPSLSLLPLGGLYLWEKGWLLYWAVGALGAILIVGSLQWLLLRPASNQSHVIEATLGADEHWSPAERAAWGDIRMMAKSIDPSTLTDWDDVFDLSTRVVRATATRLHPGSAEPEWNFTLPEALAMSEQVSRRLRRFVGETVPFGDRLTVAQFLAIYRARRFIDLADKAYDLWRIVRLLNPATAVTNEARERLTRAVYNWGKEHVTRRVLERFVEEIGRAAIDLYGGRLRVVDAPLTIDDAVPIERSTSDAGSMFPKLRSASAAAAANIGRIAGRVLPQWGKRERPR